jgi:hypothetical protein
LKREPSTRQYRARSQKNRAGDAGDFSSAHVAVEPRRTTKSGLVQRLLKRRANLPGGDELRERGAAEEEKEGEGFHAHYATCSCCGGSCVPRSA